MGRLRVIAAFPVFDAGNHYLGEVAEMGNGQWGAFDPDALRLGLFDDRAEAERLVLARRRNNPAGGACG